MKLRKARTSGPSKKTRGRVLLTTLPAAFGASLHLPPQTTVHRVPVDSGVFNDDGNRDGTAIRGESH